jgi:hypothetical protein
MSYKFESRPYGPESTPEEIQAIRDCISWYEPGILCWSEVPVQSDFHLDLVEQRLTEEAAKVAQYDLVIDLVETGSPTAPIRQRLKTIFAGQTKVRRIVVFTGKNRIINIAAKFILGRFADKILGYFKTREEALAALRR